MHRNEFAGFLTRFKFKKSRNGCIGIEREHFLILPSGQFAPRAADFLQQINDPRWTYELSACQVESRTSPHRTLSAIKKELLENARGGKKIAQGLGLRLINQEVGNENMPLDMYPDSRYLEIARTLPKETLRAACRVTGTHIHLGVKNIEHALRVYNALIPHLDALCRMGDHSHGERLKLYKTMAARWQPIRYESAEHFFEIAKKDGFVTNPRNCWQLIRISIHGTVELRMFGVTNNIDEILSWISYIMRLLQGV